MTETELIVKDLLVKYMIERHAWDVESYSKMIEAQETNNNISEIFKYCRPKLQNIYDRYLSKKERKYTLSFNSISSSPSYDPKTEHIEEVLTKSNSKIIIRTIKNDHIGERPNEYVFLKKNSEWKLDNKKTYWSFKEKWESSQL